jgi:hypothetical protein
MSMEGVMEKIKYLLLFSILVGLTGCGGGGGVSGSSDQPQTVTINIVESSATVETGATFQFHAGVDNATDTTITWTVNDVIGGNSTVGTISIEGLYTAPASVPSSNPVTVKATANADKTKYDTATVNIVPKFEISPTSVTLQISQTQQFTATLAVDHWEVNGVSGGNETVGTISTSGLYTAPALVPTPSTVTVKAYKQGDLTQVAQALVTITSPSSTLTISPVVATVAVGATQQFTANSPVDWTVSNPNMSSTDPDVIGSISAAGLYTAPLSPPWTGQVVITATSQSDASQSATAAVTVTFATASLQGDYVIGYRGFDSGQAMFLAGRFTADGHGLITSGVMDVHMPGASVAVSVGFTGTYSVGADGRGSMELSTDLGAGNITLPMRLAMTNQSSARLIGFDDTGSGWGSIVQQDLASLSAGLSGTYVFSMDGFNAQFSPVAAAGMFTANADSSLSDGMEDINVSGSASGSSFIGEWGLDAGSGRGGLVFTTTTGPNSFFIYMISASTGYLVSQKGNEAVLGLLITQQGSSFTNNSLNGGVVFASQGYTPAAAPAVPTVAFSVGRFVANGAGGTTEGIADSNVNGVIGSEMPVSATYSMAANGRGTFDITAGVATNHLIVYMISDNYALYMATDAVAVATGQFLSAPGPFSNIRRGWAFTLRGSYISAGPDATGALVAADSGGTAVGTEDYNDAGAMISNQAVAVTYIISPTTGRGTAYVGAGGASGNMVIYEVTSGGTVLLLGVDSYPMYGFATRQY